MDIVKERFDIGVRHGKKGYFGYYGSVGHLHSTKRHHKTKSAARSDAIQALLYEGVTEALDEKLGL